MAKTPLMGSPRKFKRHGQSGLGARKVERPIAGLLADLKSRGLLESTVVLWGGDFGRTPFTDGAEGGGAIATGVITIPMGSRFGWPAAEFAEAK